MASLFLPLLLLGFSIAVASGQLTFGHAVPAEPESRPRTDYVATIYSPVVTNWGTWHPAAYCATGMFAIGLQLRTEKKQGDNSDDTALNSVKLLCAPLGATTVYEDIMSYEGLWGDWGTRSICPDSIVTGFTLRSESSSSGGSDNTAANNVKMYCSNRMETEMDGRDWGSYTQRQVCPTGSGVCGIAIQYKEKGGDDTALNNIQMQCCTVPGDACKPKDAWQTVMSCDNRGNTYAVSCHYDSTVGTSKTNTQSQTEREEETRSATIGAEVGAEAKGLHATFTTEVGKSKTTGHDWTTESSDTFGTSSTTGQVFDVPGGVRKRMEQVRGVCGPNLIHTTETRFIEG